jgi:hypothetical protein
MVTAPLTSITTLEFALLEASRSLEVREADGEAVHLRCRNRRRQWLVQSPHGQVMFGMDDDDLDPELDVHVPLSDRVSWFADVAYIDAPTLSLADNATAVIGDAEVWTAIDLVPWHGDAPTPWPVRDVAAAVLPLQRFARLLASARVLPSGTSHREYPMPPMWLHVGDVGVSLHIDWRDFLPSRATYCITTQAIDGSGAICLPHRRVDEFLRSVSVLDDHDDDTQLTVAITEVYRNGSWQPAVSLRCDLWQFTVAAPDVLTERWAAGVEEQLADFDITDRDPTSWLMNVGGRPIHVRLHGGQPDVVRVSAALGTGIDDTLDLLREISALNGASTAVRFWYEDGTVWAALDLPCTRLADLADAVRQVARTVADYGPLLGAWS